MGEARISHYAIIDWGLDWAAASGAHNQERDQGDTPVDNEVPFTVGVIALSAKIAKADGVVTRDEVKAFKVTFRVSDWRDEACRPRLQSRQRGSYWLRGLCRELVTIFKGNRKLLEDVLEGLFTPPKPTRPFTHGKRGS